MKKLMNLTKEALLTVEGGDALAIISNQTSSFTKLNGSGAAMSLVGLGSKKVKLVNNQITYANKDSSGAIHTLAFTIK
jgi:hypothetical protein